MNMGVACYCGFLLPFSYSKNIIFLDGYVPSQGLWVLSNFVSHFVVLYYFVVLLITSPNSPTTKSKRNNNNNNKGTNSV
jgi:di/tricarboxylate transporter